jgi:pseudaminic acid cytidylyltransferase
MAEGSATDGVVVGVIPARGGSKRIPRKNIKAFLGTPLIARTISSALAAGVFDRLVVSTDDEEIAEVASGAGAEVPFIRSPDLADDHTGTAAVMRDAIERLESGPKLSVGGEHVALACMLYPAAVFVTGEDLRAALAQLRGSTASYVFSASSFAAPIQRAVRRRSDGRCEMFWPEHRAVRSQDLEPAYHDVGQFYWGRRDAWMSAHPVLSDASELYLIPSWRVQDIDTPEDWTRAEMLYTMLDPAG